MTSDEKVQYIMYAINRTSEELHRVGEPLYLVDLVRVARILLANFEGIYEEEVK